MLLFDVVNAASVAAPLKFAIHYMKFMMKQPAGIKLIVQDM